ncbi:ArxA, anaerobic arsenite oxidase (plasmid) [Cereibacter azotoformans]|uniref:molybdopterin-dependent oxidoreductase n=1 Tax=Cereibacter azotoformans TaxID=43057 RepID=UPI001EEBA69E|nr:molybdopterin-dependent oxidoreductase [Cereibacter azotoformans]ULB12473.1 ArxA, anaerobic arsenite oxidase [Cereibacter azotoformans]
MNEIDTGISRRRFLAATGTTGALAATVAVGVPGSGFEATSAEAQAARTPNTKITKNICHQCPARCGIDVYTTDGRVHAIYGTPDHPIANGKLCPKGPLGVYILYDPDRWKGPMKRTNPKKGRDEDPGFVPISWDEALDTVAARLNSLRDKGESHRFALCYGRGWGASCAGLQGTFGKLYGSPNVAIGHSSMCSDGSVISKKVTEGNAGYNAYDYRNTNYLLMFGVGFLEAYRPYNNNMQVWGHIRGRKSPKTRVTAVDVHVNTTLAASDRGLLIRPGTDGALALAIAHVILTEGLWDRGFVGDFRDGQNRFVAGRSVSPALFEETWVKGLVEWWNIELKDRTVDWAAGITDIPARDILATAREFGSTRPALAIFERGAHAHSNGIYNGMAIHALNALVGSFYAKGGLMNQMGPAYGDLPADETAFMDDWALNGAWQTMPRIDRKGEADGYLMANNMLQEVGPNHLAGNPYKLDTMMFYLTNPIWTAPNGQVWEEALKDVFIIDTSPFPSETGHYADLILPDHTYLERLQDAPTYPFEGYPMTQIRVPALEPLHDTKYYGDVLIEIGKRINGKMGEYYRILDNTENVLRHLARGFETSPGDNGVNSFESWVEKGVWYRKPYLWQQRNGVFYEWDGRDYTRVMTPEEVKENLIKTPSGKFEFRSGLMEENAAWIAEKTGRDPARLMFPIWEEPVHPGGGDLHLVTPKVALHAEGRGHNIPMVIAHLQPVMGGRGQAYCEINPETARARGIADGDRIRITSDVGEVEAVCRFYEGVRPDTIVMPMEYGHWAAGRWSKAVDGQHTGECTANQSDRVTGQCNYYSSKVKVAKA